MARGKSGYLKVFGGVIRGFRLRRELSQEALADAAGLHRTYISLLERGLRNPSLTVIQQLSVALGVSMTMLIGEFDSKVEGKYT